MGGAPAFLDLFSKRMNNVTLTMALVAALLLGSCAKDDDNDLRFSLPEVNLPDGFPAVIMPAENIASQERIDLGRRLFYEPLLSLDSAVSCGSCHKPELAFADDRPISPGVHGRLGMRNSPTLANVAYVARFNKDGGVPKLDLQAAVPLEDENEMALPMEVSAARLNADASYFHDFMRAYGRPADAFTITRALASFQRTILSGDSPYDQYRRGQSSALNAAQLRGMALFFGDRAQCGSCHQGLFFQADDFANNGLYLDYGRDPGRRRVTASPDDEGKFRIPTLRNAALTAPYMHDGSLPDLRAVLRHYNRGGEAHPQKYPRIRPLGLTETELSDIIAFLESLTDEQLLNNPDLRPE